MVIHLYNIITVETSGIYYILGLIWEERRRGGGRQEAGMPCPRGRERQGEARAGQSPKKELLYAY